LSRLRNRGVTNGNAPALMASMDPSPVALIGVGSNSEITSWNRAATTLLGWPATDVIGRKVLDVLGSDALAPPRAGSGPTRVRTHVCRASGIQLEVELFVDVDAYRYLTSGEYMIAVIPVVPRPTSVDAASSPPIDSWVDAAGVIRDMGSLVHCVAIGLVGVDAVNRGYSRSTGDAVLREVAARLERSVGGSGRVVRVAGNQFVVVAPADEELDASGLVEVVSQPVDTRLGRVRIGCYAGSIYGDSASGLVVLGRADSAMHRAAALGVGAVENSTKDGPRIGQRQPRLSILLMDAVARREIDVTFQPVVELTTGRILEFEALARWHSSELGDVDPAAFIEAAEDAGLIHELGQIVLAKSLDVVQSEVLAGRWGNRRVSVNLSAVQLSHPQLPTRVAEALAIRGLPGEVLQLELTGTRLLLDIEAAAERLAELRDIGVRLAIDDFGTGCANLARLRDLPIGAIKIDGRFVADICTSVADTAVIRSMVALAGELRFDVIVKGVETSGQHFALKRLGCVAAQGFLYSGDRVPADLYRPVGLPDCLQGDGFPYPHDEAGRIEALHAADVLDTPAEDVYNEIVRAAAELCGAPMSLVSLVDENRQWFKAKIGIDVVETPRDVAFCAHTICSEDLMEIPDTQDDGRFASNPFVVGDPHVRFYAGVPLFSAAGYSYGTLCVLDTVPRLLTTEQRDGLSRLARQVTVLLELRGSINQLSHAYSELELAHRERDEVEASLRYRAHYDSLTGLPNRALLMERIEIAFAESARTGQPLAMLICDLDDFKLVNDGLGHPAGDQLLVEVARRLRSCVRETDTVARFGGDEFVVVINNADQHTVAMLGARILGDMTAPISIGGRDDLRPSISIGVATQTPGVDADQLISNADAAMYRAKALGGGRMCEFDAALGADILNRLTLTTEFRTAVTNDELFCLHQPELDLEHGHLFGLESLVRWRHPTRGILLPDQFVPILEATNGTAALFERVLHLTLEAQAGWAAQLGQWPPVAVNLSARQLDDSKLADTIRCALERYSAPAESLWLEVTESALATTPTFDTLHEIHRIGVRLAIDDFGVGWSSMARLSLFPWDLLKIDRTFIAQLGQTDNAQHVIRGIISLAHSLGIQTSAEGVETVEQLRLMRDTGCDIVQGYLIDRPLTVSEALQRMTVRSHLGRADVIAWSESSSDPQRVQQLFLGMDTDDAVDLSEVVPHG
jgi:diguanylate cyclase (GGDEF)-like protein